MRMIIAFVLMLFSAVISKEILETVKYEKHWFILIKSDESPVVNMIHHPKCMCRTNF